MMQAAWPSARDLHEGLELYLRSNFRKCTVPRVLATGKGAAKRGQRSRLVCARRLLSTETFFRGNELRR